MVSVSENYTNYIQNSLMQCVAGRVFDEFDSGLIGSFSARTVEDCCHVHQ